MKLWAFICSVIALMIFWITCGILLSQYISDTVASIMQFIGIFTSYQLLYYGFWIKSKEKN